MKKTDKKETKKLQNEEPKQTKQFINRELFNKKVMTYIALIGTIALVMVYVFVYMKFTTLTETLEATNNSLQRDVEVLKEYYENMDRYQQDITAMREEIDEMLAEYPADAREEDVLMLAVNMQEENVVNFSNINMEQPALVAAVPQNIVVAAAVENMNSEVDFMEKKSTYVMETDYSNLKGLVETIYASNNRIAINNIALTMDEAGKILSGNIDVSFYSAQGTGKEYEAPDIAEYISGVSDLFSKKGNQ